METKQQGNERLKCIGEIYEVSKGSKLNEEVFVKLDSEMGILAMYFSGSKKEAFITAVIFALNCEGDMADFADLRNHFDCNPMKILEFNKDLEHLYNRNILIREKSVRHRGRQASNTNAQYAVCKLISDCIMNAKPMPVLEGNVKTKNVLSVLEELYEKGQECDDDEISTFELIYGCQSLVLENRHFPLIERVYNFNYRATENYLFLYLIWKTISGVETVDTSRVLEGIFDDVVRRFGYMQDIINAKNPLVRDGWIDIENSGFANNSKLKLSEKTLEMLEEYDIKLFNEVKKDNVIAPKDIKAKNQVFGEEEAKQLDMLYQVLEDKHFKRTQERLDAKGLPKGITVLLHGLPGTGKTESALQIAKKTNREIMKIEISQSKSMWFGESEKIIKSIFTDYRAYAKKCERTPILFFNEADAIISKRKEGSNSNVAQTENAIQNILLEEFENFDGILIATTNLISNLDSAFDRRFLFKVNYQLPTPEIKAQIWQSKLPTLPVDQCQKLATAFDFSGGQIDNIIRKIEIEEIIHGQTLCYDNILSFCQAETMRKDRVAVGFGR